MSLEDSAKEEDVSVRATGNGIRENSDDSERRADADEDGGSDCEEGGSEGRAVAAADVPVVMNALEERLPSTLFGSFFLYSFKVIIWVLLVDAMFMNIFIIFLVTIFFFPFLLNMRFKKI